MGLITALLSKQRIAVSVVLGPYAHVKLCVQSVNAGMCLCRQQCFCNDNLSDADKDTAALPIERGISNRIMRCRDRQK